MNYYTWCRTAYDKGYANQEQLKVWVERGKITPEEYYDITGVEYIPPVEQ